MKFLDSTFLIDFLRSDKNAIKIALKFNNERLATSSINIFEVMLGVHLDNKFEEKIERFKELISSIHIFSFGLEESFAASKIASSLIKKGSKIDDLDSLIVGVMKNNNISEIVTKDKHFSRIKGIKIIKY